MGNDIADGIDIRQLRVDDKVTVDLKPSQKKKGRFEAHNVVPEDPDVSRREKKEPRRRYDDNRGGGRDRYDDRRGGGRNRYDDRRGGGRDRRDDRRRYDDRR